MLDRAAVELGIARRRESRSEEFREHERLAGLLLELLDPDKIFWSSLENRPASLLSGLFAKRRGCRSGLPDLVFLWRNERGELRLVCIELKSKRGSLSAAQKQVREDLLRIGADWWLCRSAEAALVALHRSGVPLIALHRAWRLPKVQPHEGPFSAEESRLRLPQHPMIARERAEAKARYRERLRARKAALAAAREVEMRHAG